MSSEDEARKKQEELRRKLAGVPERCAAIEKVAGQALRDAADARAAAKYDDVLAKLMPVNHPLADKFFADQLGVWEVFDKSTYRFMEPDIKFSPVTVAVWGTSANAAVSSSAAFDFVTLAPERREEYDLARKEFAHRLELEDAVSDVKENMRRLSLSGKALENAYAALRTPGAPGAGSALLLVLRGAIDDAIAELVRRRPEQDEAGRRHRRVIALGKQCARQNVPLEHFERLAADYTVVHTALSDEGKSAVLPWDAISQRFVQGLAFFRALLIAIDEGRLRGP